MLDVTVPARGSWSGTVRKGEVLRIVDLEGQQAVDFICFNAADKSEAYDSTVTVRLVSRAYLQKGDILYSSLARPLFTIQEDTVGHHDTICGCCSAEINDLRYGVKNTPSCRANFLQELRKHELDARSVVSNINFFMYIPFNDRGGFSFQPPLSKPGDYVDLLAHMDILVVVSNCPQTLNPANNFNPTPIQIKVSTQGQPAGP